MGLLPGSGDRTTQPGLLLMVAYPRRLVKGGVFVLA